MKDKWSLKDRMHYNPNHTSGEPKIVYEHDIETLREKLIEDIDKIMHRCINNKSYEIGDAYRDIYNAIDKLFGVK